MYSVNFDDTVFFKLWPFLCSNKGDHYVMCISMELHQVQNKHMSREQ